MNDGVRITYNRNVAGEPLEVVHHQAVFVNDTSKYWYKPKISRDEAIEILRDKPPGTFLIRDSSSYPGAYGLALKVSQPPAGVQVKSESGSELVRHFLIESSSVGVKLKGCANEPTFGSLAALVYQHSVTPLALPSKLLLIDYDPALLPEQANEEQRVPATTSAACNLVYLHTSDTESLTGPQAIRRVVDEALRLASEGLLHPLSVHFRVSATGVTLTDNTRQLFFRRHYNLGWITYTDLDPERRRWNVEDHPAMIFGFVNKKMPGNGENECHIFAESDPSQPATAIVTYLSKYLAKQ